MDNTQLKPIVKKSTEKFTFIKIIILFSLVPLFFINLGSRHTPLMLEVIESGHFFVFFITALFIFPIIKLPIPERFLFSLIGVVAISFVVESLQEAVGRNFSMIDIYRNLIGFGMGASFMVLRKAKMTKLKLQSWAVFVLLLTVTLIERQSLIHQVANEINTFNNFEILAEYIDILPSFGVSG